MKKLIVFFIAFCLMATCAHAAWKVVTFDLQLEGFDYYEADTNTIYTAGDALTLTGTDFDFDGGAAPGGELGGTWALPTVDATHSGSAHHAAVTALEGTAILSTGEGGATKFLREDGDGTSSWQTPAGGGDFKADGTVDMTGNFNINTQAIEDANSNELVTFVTEASAVNNIQITNAATGSGVKLTAVGGDTNIDLHLEPKGIGSIRLEETLPSTAGQSLAEIIIDVDSSAQVSTSEWRAILVETTGTPAGMVTALETVGKVNPFLQHVATFATPNQDEYAGKKKTSGTVWVDGDTPAIGENLDGFEIFVANSDEIYFGSATQFDEVEVIMGTGATKNVVPTFWYSSAGPWTQFFPEDGTDGFQESGDIFWLLSGITGLWTNDGDPGVDDTTAGYWIKIIRTRVSDPGSPTPTTVKIGLATTYFLDKTGAMDVLSMEADTITEGGNAVWNDADTDIVDNSHINWVDIDYLTEEGAGINEAYAVGWNADVGPAEKDDIYDYLVNFDSDADSSFTDETWYTNILDGTAVFSDLNGNDILDSDNYNADSIDDEHINWGAGANQISIADLSGNQVSGALVWDFGSVTSFEIPQDATVDAVGKFTLDTTDGVVVIHDGTAARVFADDIKQATYTVYTDGDWTDDAIPIWIAPKDMAVTIVQVSHACVGGTSVTYNIEERAWAGLAAGGTDIWASDQVADTNGEDETAFSNAGIAAKAHLVVVPSASVGDPTILTGVIYYRLDVE